MRKPFAYKSRNFESTSMNNNTIYKHERKEKYSLSFLLTQILILTPPPPLAPKGGRDSREMPLRNEFEAYWDDIERHIADVEPVMGTAALSKLCPAAAAARDALKSRLQSVNEERASVERQRARAMAESHVVRNEDVARHCLAEKAARLQHAAAFVRGRLENDRLQAGDGGGGTGRELFRSTAWLRARAIGRTREH